MAHLAYRVLLWVAFPWVLARLWWRGRREPGYRRGIAERFGFYGAPPAGPVLWLHAVSVGETRAAEPLLRALKARHPECELLVTQMTATGREAAAQVFGGAVRVAWLPYDYPSAMKRFLRHFRPRLGILMETEIWFNLVDECARAGVPLVLANARMSARSARGYTLVAPLVRSALARLSAIAAQTPEDAERLGALGGRGVEITGNLKFDALPGSDSESLASRFRGWFGERPVLLAASTREGEEELLLDAMERNALGNALFVIVPRHPQRFEAVARVLAARGLKFARRSANAVVEHDCDIVLGDSMGEMGAYYRACDAALVGGSLLAYGGQNLIEACAAGVPVLLGPYTYNFAQAAESAIVAGAAVRVKDAAEAITVARALLQDRERRERMGGAGVAFCSAHRGATGRTLAICERLLRPGACSWQVP
ncbi:MAG: lipid IV(A) 3-deoxy-D-manno-octulosonic acid transferase [Burkholderiales bacterium]